MDLAALLFPLISACSPNLVPCPPSPVDLHRQSGDNAELHTLHQAALTQEEAGRWEQAAATYRDELRLLDRLGQPGKIAFAEVYISLAGIYHVQGRLQDAVAVAQRVGARLAGAFCGAIFHPKRLVTGC